MSLELWDMVSDLVAYKPYMGCLASNSYLSFIRELFQCLRPQPPEAGEVEHQKVPEKTGFRAVSLPFPSFMCVTVLEGSMA